MRRGLGLQTLCPHQADEAKAAQRSRGKVSAGATWGDRTIEGGGQGGMSTHDAVDGKAGPLCTQGTSSPCQGQGLRGDRKVTGVRASAACGLSPWSSNAWVSSCPITTPMPPKLRALWGHGKEAGKYRIC